MTLIEIMHSAKSLQVKNSDLAVIEYVSPYKLAVAFFLYEFMNLRERRKMVINDEVLVPLKDSEFVKNLMTLKPICKQQTHQRRDFCRLLLKLMQTVDKPLSKLSEDILLSKEYEIHFTLKTCWRNKLVRLGQEPVSGIMAAMNDMERLMLDNTGSEMPLLSRHSVSGLFLRRIMLGFEKLSFSEVSSFAGIFQGYIHEGLPYFKKFTFILEDYCSNDSYGQDMNEALEVLNLNKELDTIEEDMRSYEPVAITNTKWTRKQSDLYVSKQVALLQNCENHADSPTKIENIVKTIIASDPDMSQVHYLSYLNSLRIHDFCQAVKSLYWSSDRSCFQSESFYCPENSQSNDNEKLSEDADRGFRYAALNLAAMHARFQHQEEALLALKEAIMMAQEANDHLCLQHALTWLFKIQPRQKKYLMRKCISKCNSLGLSYLTSLGMQSLAQVLDHEQPSVIMDLLNKSDMLNCQHSLISLILNSYAQKAAFWTFYGRGQEASIVSQLLLHLDSSDPFRDNLYMTGEPEAIAMVNVAKRLFDAGCNKECDAVMELCKSLFPRESSLCGSIWKAAQIQIEFQRCLHQTDWSGAEHCIQNYLAFAKDSWQPLFMSLQLYLSQGKAHEASEICDKLTTMHNEMPSQDKVQALLFQAEVFCLTQHYPDAIAPLMGAMKIAQEQHLDYFSSLVKLHTAHVQLQLGLPGRALQTAQSTLSIILSHGSLFEASRARVLLAKCLVASSTGQRQREATRKAIKHLQKAFDDFMCLRAHHRAKDVLYLKARLYHALGVYQERNHISAELKRLEDQYATTGASQLAIML